MTSRITVDGRFLVRDGVPWRLRGVTYGAFVPRVDGEPFPEAHRVKEDFRLIAERGLNTVRVYELPPVDVLDAADDFGLHLLVGLNFHDWRMEQQPSRAARQRIRTAGMQAIDAAVARCADRDGVIGIGVGNEMPNDVVRVHGIASVEDLLGDLIERVHDHSDLLATYVNFPTTEFLQAPGQDLVTFNVFLEDPSALGRYLRHLQVAAGPGPLVITELGLASLVHGDAEQAASIDAQLREVDDAGCAGATVFSWTDEWGFDGEQVHGWGFGITDMERRPRPALNVVERWARRSIGDVRDEWPKVSVVVCAYNEESTIEECLRSLAQCTYPHLEVIVCDDGSTDRTMEIARRFPFRILELAHGGLSRARNAGMEAASGEIVAYLDADAACHPEWPFHLALSLEHDGVVATGGPNLPVAEVGLVERAVALSPGGPLEVLTTDDRAEHVPGCNMAFRARDLEAIGGFDAVYTSAGDDVDVCWKLLDRGQEIAFAPAAQVRHHRRSRVLSYLRQQRGYGRAEKMLLGAHPGRFNRLGQARWRGVIYGGAGILPSVLRPIVYHGYQGAAPFQPIARRRSDIAGMCVSAWLPMMLPIAIVGATLGVLASTWWFALSAIAMAAVVAYGVAIAVALRPDCTEPRPVALRAVVGLLHVLQPFWRTYGRVRGVRHGTAHASTRPPWTGDRWAWLHDLERRLHASRCSVRSLSPNDTWDMQVTKGPFVAARITTAVTWGWVPHTRVDWRVRPAFWWCLAASLAAGFVATELALALASVVLVAALVNLALLRRRVHSALGEPMAGMSA